MAKKTEELKDLLKKFKSEVSYSDTGISPEAGLDFKNRLITEQSGIFKSKPLVSASRDRDAHFQKAENKIPFNVVWSENKETVIFGIMASVLVILAGIISSTDYLVLVGAVGFVLFVFVMFLLMFHYVVFLRKTSDETNVNVDAVYKRIDALEHKILRLSYEKGSRMEWSKEKELENKIEELRTIVKSISQAITQWK